MQGYPDISAVKCNSMPAVLSGRSCNSCYYRVRCRIYFQYPDGVYMQGYPDISTVKCNSMPVVLSGRSCNGCYYRVRCRVYFQYLDGYCIQGYPDISAVKCNSLPAVLSCRSCYYRIRLVSHPFLHPLLEFGYVLQF